MVFAVVVIAELLAFVITLLSPGVIDDPWGNLGLISMLVQWIALASAALLCVARPLLSRMSNSCRRAGELPAGTAGHGRGERAGILADDREHAVSCAYRR